MDSKRILQQSSEDTVNDLFQNIRLQWLQHWDVLSFLIIASAKVLYYEKHISPELFDLRRAQSPVIASVLCIAALAYLFREQGRIKFLYIINLAISLILIADTIYYRYSQDILTLAILKNQFLVRNIISNIYKLTKPMDFIYLIDVLIGVPFLGAMIKIRQRQPKINIRLLTFSVIFFLGVALDGEFIYKLSREKPLFNTAAVNKIYVAKNLGSINFHALDVYNFIVEEINGL